MAALTCLVSIASIGLGCFISEQQALDNLIDQCDLRLKWAVEQYFSDECIALAQSIQNETAIAVSDGSFKEGFGMAGFILEGWNSDSRILGVNVTPGGPVAQSSYRSEILGLCGIICLVNLVCESFGITTGSITIGCNGHSALKSVFGEGEYWEAVIEQTDYDIISSFCTHLRKSPSKWRWQHIKGHQDNDGTTVLHQWSTLNVEMDNVAIAYWIHCAPEGPNPNITLTDELWTLHVNGLKVLSDAARTCIYDHIHGEQMFECWE
jgi:hypothetical protein